MCFSASTGLKSGDGTLELDQFGTLRGHHGRGARRRVDLEAVSCSVTAGKHNERGWRIINIGSCNADRMPFAGGVVYAMSKSGLVRGPARDLGDRGITINIILPGPVATEMNPANSDSAEILKKLMALPSVRHG